MSQASMASNRNLSLTEELEKLEQSITLTLQEIDHNFSKAHRIVTTSILPIVEQYAEHSKTVWEGSKFWKQFFEASANVSLSGYEELAADDEEEDSSLSQSFGNTTSQRGDETIHNDGTIHDGYEGEDSLLDTGDISGSTPRPPQSRDAYGDKPKFADYPSPYEALKREIKGGKREDDDTTSQMPPTTPGPEQRLPDMSMTPTSSPAAIAAHISSTAQRRPGADPLLHRILDKNYRLQATPHTTRKEANTPVGKLSWQDNSSPMSSPPVAAPQLHAEIFSSPLRQADSRVNAPRTPGVSVQASLKQKGTQRAPDKEEISWESDSDQDADDVYKELGMSPPKTIQFAVAPSRLLQTPAREASRRIVEDLLMTAGAGQDTDEEDSPSMIKMKDTMLDDSF